jgi:group I intron endonuclease
MGVYCIRHAAISGLAYIGSSIRMERRMASHRSSLRRGRHHCSALQSAWDAYGEQAFRLEVLECVNDETHLADLERRWTNAMRDQVGGVYNRVAAVRHVTPTVHGAPT